MKSFQIPKHNHINAMQYQYSVFCIVVTVEVGDDTDIEDKECTTIT